MVNETNTKKITESKSLLKCNISHGRVSVKIKEMFTIRRKMLRCVFSQNILQILIT